MFQFLDIPMEVFRGEGAGCLQFTLKRFRKIKCVYMYVAWGGGGGVQGIVGKV